MLVVAFELTGTDRPPVVGLPALRDPDALGKKAFLQELLNRDSSRTKPQPHGRSLVAPLLGEPLEVVAPYHEREQPLDGTLPSLGMGNRLALVVGAAVADQEVEQVDRPQGILSGAGRPRADGAVL